ncbi:MAG: hypothetical protein EU552_01880 [Promethearchaeota archaeon]|nr:MAG: hypothetical protein EU552_01880 [Candidatus Lokiarchaeota archaeon]
MANNTANSHDFYGIYLGYSDYNIISENSLLLNKICIKEKDSYGNIFSNNGPCMLLMRIFYESQA